jgi:hypothetical protein
VNSSNEQPMSAFYERFQERLDVEDELKHEIHSFITADMDWKQSQAERTAIA